MIKPYNFSSYKRELIESFDISPLEFDSEWEKWESQRGSSISSEKDFLNEMFNKRVNRISLKYNDLFVRYQKLGSLYNLVWEFIIIEQRNGTEVKELLNFCHLKCAETNKHRSYVIVISSNGCEAGIKIDGLAISLHEAILNQPIPYSKCSRRLGCICSYGIHAESDFDGHLIMK